ncbi:hypothetical protein FIM04_02375 [SAR202 cluster bacterium AC-409-J13_OGT_754m]|nr:hypothetical protein [SAR202 cluster bacterium AC-409-J13_OGT_754m]
MKWASALSENPDTITGLSECISEIEKQTDVNSIDLAVLFITDDHKGDFRRIPLVIHERLNPTQFVGCSAGGVIGNGKEVEHRSGISLTVASLPQVNLNSFHVDDDALPDLDAPPTEWETLTGMSADKDPQFLIITDPFTIRSQNLLLGLDYAFKKGTKIGGMASGSSPEGGNTLFLGDKTFDSGAVAIIFDGNIVIDPVVAQGCRPIGTPMRITRSERNVLIELDGRPTVEILKEIYKDLTSHDRELVRHSLFLGMVMDKFEEDPQLGDFLIRNIVGIDPSTGAMAIGEGLEEGQIVQFHLRDANTSQEDLSGILCNYSDQHAPMDSAGALLFSCLGRGEYLYGLADHDTNMFKDIIGDIPLGGFFCNGEIGPVGGTTYLHGYTSSFGIFRTRG